MVVKTGGIAIKAVSKQNLGIDCMDHICKAPYSNEGYRFY